jgi:hypothetical protein
LNIIRGKLKKAKKVVIYGPEGIGKSTFASKFPDPVFIDTEGSTNDMDIARFEKATSWQMLTDQIRYVRSNPSVCKTLVIDTADWAEQMCINDLCARNGKKGIEDFGYGNGYVYAKEDFGRFLNLLSDVVDAGVNVVITAHAQIRKFEQPDELGAYDRYELKLGKKTQSQTSPLLKEWADMLLFANYKTVSVAVDDKGKKHKAQGGRRVMYTSHHPCWDAKNRYELPEELPFEYDSIRHIVEGTGQKKQEEKTQPPKIEKPAAPEQKQEPQKAPTKEEQRRIELEQAFTVDKRVPKALRDLMEENAVVEQELMTVVGAKGYFPPDMPIWDYPVDFIDGVLVGAWDKVFSMIMEMRNKQEIPFD